MTQRVPLPEDHAPPEAGACHRCSLSSQRTRVIWGEGKPCAPAVILLDNPGAREDAAGRAFLCPTRATLLAALAAAGLANRDVYVTYVLKCRPRRRYERRDAWDACLPWLQTQLHAGPPKVIAALGNNVLRALIRDPKAEVRENRGRILSWSGYPLVVSYHPLAARRQPGLFPLLVSDLGEVRKIAARTPPRP